MSDRRLPPTREDDPDIARAGSATPSFQNVDYNQIARNIQDMTQIAADALTQAKYLEHAVPAQEATKQAKELTKREVTKNTSIFVCVLAALYVVYLNPASGFAVAAIVAVLGGASTLDRWVDKKKESPAPP